MALQWSTVRIFEVKNETTLMTYSHAIVWLIRSIVTWKTWLDIPDKLQQKFRTISLNSRFFSSNN